MHKPKGRLDLICEQVGIRIRPITRRRKGPETHARETLRKLMRDHGEGHLTLVLRAIRESKGNAGEAWSEVISAVSDVLLLRPVFAGEQYGNFLVAMDALNLGTLRRKHKARRPWPMREGIRTDILNHVERYIDGSAQLEIDGF
jgi:hypothetical protein